MPITCQQSLQPLSREAFSRLSYDLMADVFAIRNELGRFFEEKLYKQALALRRQDVKLEVPVCVSHQTFSKTYFLDVLFAAGAIIEFKATEALSNRHRTQLLHYLLLTDLEHGLLVNLRPEQVAKEFVNCSLRRSDQRDFCIAEVDWHAGISGATQFRTVLTALLEDWGASLELSLYEEALTYFLGGEEAVLRPVKVHLDGAELGQQLFRLVADRVAFKLTAFNSRSSQHRFVNHARQLVSHTDLDALLLANLDRHEVTFSCLLAEK